MFGCGTIDTNIKRSINKADILFLTAVLAAASVFFLIFRLHGTQGESAVVSYDGADVFKLPLEQAEPRYYLILYESGAADIEIKEFSTEEWNDISLPDADYNAFFCGNGEIRMLESSCPDKICVRHAAVSHTLESIICLPHKLVIEIEASKESDLDGVAY